MSGLVGNQDFVLSCGGSFITKDAIDFFFFFSSIAVTPVSASA